MHKIDPFAMEPIRANVLQLPQILKEVSSLEASINQIQQSILASKKSLMQETDLPKKVVTESQVSTSEFTGQEEAFKKTSQVYQTQGPLPKRFEEPRKVFYSKTFFS